MIIKSPPCYDISHWKIVPDFKAIYPKPLLMITKATEGINYVDPTFVKYMIGMKEAGCHRGCYHFNRKIYKGADQARHFIAITSGYIDKDTLLILDVEEGGESVSELWSFFETVRAKYPNNRLMLYSRKNILDPIKMTWAEADYFRRIPIWTAGYPINPDEYNTPPMTYTPDPLKYGPVYLWQYTDSGRIEGISGDVDCNWISPNLQLFLGNPPSNDGEIPTTALRWYRVTATALNYRNGPGASYSDIGDLFKGDYIATTTAPLGNWYKIDRIYRTGGRMETVTQTAWCSGAYLVSSDAPVKHGMTTYRQPHDLEIVSPGPKAASPGRDYRGNHTGTARECNAASIPEVYQLLPEHVTPLTPDWVNLVCAINYDLPRDQAMKIFDPHWAFNNGRETPGYDKPRVCGGAFLSGYMDGGNLHIYSLLTSQPVPSADYVLERPYLWYYGVALNSRGQLSYMTLSDGNGGRIPVKIPLITRLPVYVPLKWLHRLESGFMPSPLWMS